MQINVSLLKTRYLKLEGFGQNKPVSRNRLKNVIKIRLYPDRAQGRDLEETLETCRLVYNSMVNDRKFQYDTTKVSVGYFTQKAYLPVWKKSHPELREVYSQVLQDVVHRVELAFKAFFERISKGEKKIERTPGFPRLNELPPLAFTVR